MRQPIDLSKYVSAEEIITTASRRTLKHGLTHRRKFKTIKDIYPEIRFYSRSLTHKRIEI